jgi:diaminopimelate decarboxylase
MFSLDKISHLSDKPTPFYFYDLKLLSQTLDKLVLASRPYNFKLHYALKANFNPVILEVIKNYKLGADCVSGNEVAKAIALGFNPNKIVFAGVGKTDKEINFAIDHDLFSLNCESLQEIQVINEIAAIKGKQVSIAVRINPNINANTHHHITTGLKENKFGLSISQIPELISNLSLFKNIKLEGLHFHIGSQIIDLKPFKDLCYRANEILTHFNSAGIFIKHLNMGGGLGIDYQNPDENGIADFEGFFKVFHENLTTSSDIEIHFELGRSIVGQCGTLISKALFTKKAFDTTFIILDAGMTELIRPALYQAYHKIENISSKQSEFEKYDVVGPVCESSDCFGKSILLPNSQRNDFFAIRSAGAYGEVMASNYNLREKAESYFNK